MYSNIPQDLIDAIKSNNVIPLIGAGVSMSLTDNEGKRVFPSWSELLQHASKELMCSGQDKLAKGINAMLDLDDYQQAAKFARQGLHGTLWNQFFKKHFDEPLSKVSEDGMALPKAIWGLGNRILTLNYDKVLRKACPNMARLLELDKSTIAELADFKRDTLGAPAIWHFHGRVGNIDTVIFTAESYDKLYAETDKDYLAALETFRGLCRDQRLLFVGCSLEDAELIQEMAKQHQLFAGNTGPHFALVHKKETDNVKRKISGLPVDIVSFEDFGEPLLRLVKAIAAHAPPKNESTHAVTSIPSDPQPQLDKEHINKIALLSASPLNDEQHYNVHIKEFKKIHCHIDHYPLTISNLNNLAGYDYLLILSKVIKNKILIEDDHLCRRVISLDEFEEQIGNDNLAGIFFFVDQLPEQSATEKLCKPTLILAEQDKNELEKALFQLFRKNNLDSFKNHLLCNRASFSLCPLSDKIQGTNIHQKKTPLPDSIDPKTVRNFIGRINDLENICRKLINLEDEGSVLTIKGSGGIGKTTTVKKIAVALSERGNFEGGIFFVECEPITDSQQFQYKVAASFNLEQAEDLKQHLRDHHDHRKRLILLDNFETLLYLKDVENIKSVLSLVCDYATIVITSRERLNIEGEDVYEMRQFTTDEAVELFKACLNIQEISTKEISLLRQDIIENLLDNNPLAIKLITKNMPEGKQLSVLKEELETDLFSKISESELEVFDSYSDLNIARKKSIYGSILYSYEHLLESEKKAFELLSLFPDGIELEVFKRLTQGQKDSKGSGKSGLHQALITDTVIKALENKSMLENNSGLIKLQSIVGRFAEAQLLRRDSLVYYYNNAFIYNKMLANALRNIKKENKTKALAIFNSQQGNLLKSISYCDKLDCDSFDIIEYIEDLIILFIEICSLKGFIRELYTKVDMFHDMNRKVVEAQLLQARYFDGDFDRAFAEIKQLVPLESLDTLDRKIPIECKLADMVSNTYAMEGDALCIAKYDKKYKPIIYEYPNILFLLGEYNQQLAECCKYDFFSLEVMANMGLPVIDLIDDYLSKLYGKAQLERMQVSYIRSKLEPLKKEEIEALVTVNPYTRGIKELMLAFIEPDITKADQLYQESISHLSHIRYYHVDIILTVFRTGS